MSDCNSAPTPAVKGNVLSKLMCPVTEEEKSAAALWHTAPQTKRVVQILSCPNPAGYLQHLKEENIPRLHPPTRQDGEPPGDPWTWTRTISHQTEEGSVSFEILDVYKIVPWKGATDPDSNLSALELASRMRLLLIQKHHQLNRQEDKKHEEGLTPMSNLVNHQAKIPLGHTEEECAMWAGAAGYLKI